VLAARWANFADTEVTRLLSSITFDNNTTPDFELLENTATITYHEQDGYVLTAAEFEGESEDGEPADWEYLTSRGLF